MLGSCFLVIYREAGSFQSSFLLVKFLWPDFECDIFSARLGWVILARFQRWLITAQFRVESFWSDFFFFWILLDITNFISS